VPHGHFATKDGKWVAISCATDLLFERLARAMGGDLTVAPGPGARFELALPGRATD